MGFKEALIRRARIATKSEGLPTPKKIQIYEKKKFPKSYVGTYGETIVRQRKGRPVTSATKLFIRRMPAPGFVLTNDEVKMAMAHELSHLKYANHTEYQKEYARYLYKKYLKKGE